MERMQIVIADSPDLAQRRFQVLGAIERHAVTERKSSHAVQAHRVQSTISVPSAGECQPARPAISRSGGGGSSARVGLFLWRKIFWPLSRPPGVWGEPWCAALA